MEVFERRKCDVSLKDVCSCLADRVLGHVCVGGFMFARGSGVDHWEEVKKNQKIHIQRWHQLSSNSSSGTGGGGGGTGDPLHKKGSGKKGKGKRKVSM